MSTSDILLYRVIKSQTRQRYHSLFFIRVYSSHFEWPQIPEGTWTLACNRHHPNGTRLHPRMQVAGDSHSFSIPLKDDAVTITYLSMWKNPQFTTRIRRDAGKTVLYPGARTAVKLQVVIEMIRQHSTRPCTCSLKIIACRTRLERVNCQTTTTSVDAQYIYGS